MTTFRSTNAKERFIYHSAGLDGTGSGSYIDDVVLCDADVNSGWTSAADSTKEVRRTYLQNWRHDIVVVLDAGGRLLENVKYLSYGTPFACPAGDTELKGSWLSSDSTRISSYAGSYDIRFDPTHNGVIDAADITYANSIKSGYQTLGLGVLSSTAVGNRKGYAGYEHAPELAGAKWHVRHRVLDAELGRWTRRDPLGYVDGCNINSYIDSAPIPGSDPLGLLFTHFVDYAFNAFIGGRGDVTFPSTPGMWWLPEPYQFGKRYFLQTDHRGLFASGSSRMSISGGMSTMGIGSESAWPHPPAPTVGWGSSARYDSRKGTFVTGLTSHTNVTTLAEHTGPCTTRVCVSVVGWYTFLTWAERISSSAIKADLEIIFTVHGHGPGTNSGAVTVEFSGQHTAFPDWEAMLWYKGTQSNVYGYLSPFPGPSLTAMSSAVGFNAGMSLMEVSVVQSMGQCP